ncbi:MAG: hypothetical protein LBC45_00010 [Chlamydiales bacterium]|jgi:hypothetical protein|nr:hypothetical protein [Chlamydiales bacterium]
MLKNASGLAITAVALCVLSNLSSVSAGHCEDQERICVNVCDVGWHIGLA